MTREAGSSRRAHPGEINFHLLVTTHQDDVRTTQQERKLEKSTRTNVTSHRVPSNSLVTTGPEVQQIFAEGTLDVRGYLTIVVDI